MFTLSSTPIDPAPLKDAMANAEAGAFVSFEGWVRNHNEGRAVASLEYEAFAELAQHEANAIIDAARRDFAILDAHCVHRVGHLAIGELAVWVGVTARHRDAAFRACRAIIDAIKARVPIWKKEHYLDGAAEWVNCAACAQHAAPASDGGCSVFDVSAESAFYRRQVALPSVGAAGQARLKSARVVVIGAGGLGCPALHYLAAAGIGSLSIWDGDSVDASNLHRQVLFDYAAVGRNKAEAAAERLRAQNPFITIEAHPLRVQAAQLATALADASVVLDCTDNFESKFLIHDACRRAAVPLVQAAIYQFEGQLQVFTPGTDAGCMRCLWPEAPEDGCVGTCADVGVLGVVPGVLGTLQAAETLKLLLGLPEICDRDTLLVDLLRGSTQRLSRPRNPNCPLCGHSEPPPPPAATTDWLVDATALSPATLARYEVIDIRNADERVGNPPWILRLRHMPFPDFAPFLQLAPDRTYLLACAHGIRSRALASRLHRAGHPNFASLRQGVDALAPLLA